MGSPWLASHILGDQPFNAQRIEHKGYGIAMNIHDFTTEQLMTNIRKILDDVTYKERVTLASNIFRSDVQTPGERESPIGSNTWPSSVVITWDPPEMTSTCSSTWCSTLWVVFTIAFLLIIIRFVPRDTLLSSSFSGSSCVQNLKEKNRDDATGSRRQW